MSLKVCLVLIVGLGSVCSTHSGSCTMFQPKPEYLNKYLNGYSFSETESPNHLECSKLCMSFSICKSFDYYRPEKNCKLNGADSTSVQEHEFTHLPGAIFSDISDWPNSTVGSCGKRPCAPDKRCVPYSGDLDGKYDCIDSDKVYRDCKDVLRINPDAKSGPYTIVLLESKKRLSVYCDMDTEGGGWTVFQRRFNNRTDFFRNYSEYENGFGTASEEFWLGLKNIQELANQGVTELRLDGTAFASDNEGHESYKDFKLVQPDYTLQLGSTGTKSGYYGAWYSSLRHNNGSGFSTYDHDVDTSTHSGNRASLWKGAWWYSGYEHVDLNSLYSTSSPCMHHYGLAGDCLRSTSMMLRRTTKRSRN